MLSLFGPARTGYCDGVTRRDFLRIGGLALGGLSLPGLLRAESQAGVRRSHKAVIMIFLAGGPPHQDMFDLKPDAPEGIRGEFRPIPTNVPGLDICEYMPRLARMMDRFAVIRSIVGAGPDHSAGQCLTGYKRHDQQGAGRPAQPRVGGLAPERAGPSGRARLRRALAADRRAAVGQPRRAGLPGPVACPVHAVPLRVEGEPDRHGRRRTEPG